MFLLAALWLVCGGAYAADSAAVDGYLRAQMAARQIPGLSVAVVQEGRPLLLKGYGLANVELGVPATDQTVYQLASVTKQFTATAVMLLVEDGKLSLSDPVSKYLEDLPEAWRPVTVRQLLDHTSGIKSYTSVPNFFATAWKDYTKPELLALVRDAPPDFKPGEKWSYNNTAYFLVGMVIEKASGKEYGAFLKERVFEPLGMAATRLNDRSAIIPNRASGYTRRAGGTQNAPFVSPTQPYSAGALVSTVADMAKWDAALYTDRLLKRESLEQMWTPAKLNDDKSTAYGLGWSVNTYRTRKRISHGGGIPGFSTAIDRFVDDKLTVVVLVNSDGGAAGSIAAGIAEFFIPALRENAPKPIGDEDPKTTVRLKEVVEALLAGKADAEPFTPEAWRLLFPDRIQEARDFVRGRGPIKSFELMERRMEEKDRLMEYRAVFGELAVRIRVTMAEDGKIARLGFRLE